MSPLTESPSILIFTVISFVDQFGNIQATTDKIIAVDKKIIDTSFIFIFMKKYKIFYLDYFFFEVLALSATPTIASITAPNSKYQLVLTV